MTLLQRHILLPSLAPLLFCAVTLSPVEWLGCRNRGLLAVLIALVAALLGVAAAGRALSGRLKGETESAWWAGTALLLALPAVGVLILA